MAKLMINGTAMPEPSYLSINYQDLDSDNTKRDETGVMHRDRIRGNVHKLIVKWNAVSNADAAIILQAVSGVSFSVTFYDPRSGGNVTITAYVGDRSNEEIASQIGDRWNISFDIIEY